jgi:hypothetical protein
MAAVYVPRSPTTGVLYGVVRTHLTEFLAAVDAQTDGSGLPGFIIKEFRKFLGCGLLSRGFARVRCGDCAFERLVPFSCKGRAICASCGGRRMTERATHLVDHVLPADVPVRQWVLSVPHRLRYRLAYDHRLCRTVLHVFVRALRSAYRRAARRNGLSGGETGMVTSVQRFGGSVNVHLHFHTLVLDGVYVQEADGLRFHATSPPTDEDVRRVVVRVPRRLERLGLLRDAARAEVDQLSGVDFRAVDCDVQRWVREQPSPVILTTAATTGICAPTTPAIRTRASVRSRRTAAPRPPLRRRLPPPRPRSPRTLMATVSRTAPRPASARKRPPAIR